MKTMDWNRAQAFLATAEAGSLSAAARQLGLTQPTLSRQVAALEAELDATLFERVGKKLVLTETGMGLLEHARAMGEAANALTLAASGHTQAIEGRVSISASDAYAAYILPDIAERIREEAPQITLVIISRNSLSDLRRREADIAIRHVRPDEDGLVGKLVRESTANFYASQSWLSRNERPKSMADIAQYLIGFEDTERFAQFMRGIGIPATEDGFRLVSENSVVVWEMVKRGLGISAMMREIAERTTGIVELFPETEAAKVPVWLVTHRELRTSRRIRVVYDILAEELTRLT
ncbi:Bacterial regulatory helix-turn-helix protein, lysR family protein [Candidatus Filomicrobium marinum]|uniref:Bacterial regulatory helix-turn-helix protein, lysR family protein n=2 Tax=Candidatus Filomicrobium marinum TaxID=1608628 RepID=A0A0D6J9R3_9HYPH|nr:LysR family transcriptional regulator [Candidatus Filomicrobium marinum]CFW97804.1 Bacterial regulatory helix-turn-helix protein, lysR family protein [Candidatus Filomicrobium marinum]CPR14779.1 Bacterial regulatory helix-turn-helix protein, lysR family protein [Candidatus Filomicrobium marinum]